MRLKKLALTLCLYLLSATAAFASDLLLKKVQLVDVEHETVQERSLWLSEGRIKAILPQVPAHFAGDVVDLSGRWVVPAFTDMHDHSTFNNPGPQNVQEALTTEVVAERMLYAGVTSFVDLFADETAIFEFRKRQRKLRLPGARLYAAGPMFTCTGGHGSEFGIPTRLIDSPASARRQVAELAVKKPDVVKFAYDHARDYPSMNEATLRAGIAEARRHQIPTVVHIGTWQDAKEAVLAGATLVTHLYESEIPDALVTLLRERKTQLIPTMTYQGDLLNFVEDRSLLEAPLLRDLAAPYLLDAYRHIDTTFPWVSKIIAEQNARRESYRRTLLKVAQAGIPLMTGTDSGDLGVFQGYSVHREMAIFVKAGLSPWQALAAASTLPKRFFHHAIGTLVGDLADFVVLKGSPIADITQTQAIEMVFQEGKLINRELLLATRRTAAKPQ